jgi:hypothetical protein
MIDIFTLGIFLFIATISLEFIPMAPFLRLDEKWRVPCFE